MDPKCRRNTRTKMDLKWKAITVNPVSFDQQDGALAKILNANSVTLNDLFSWSCTCFYPHPNQINEDVHL